MRANQSFRAASLLALAIAMVASACTKSKELKNNVDPDAYVSKADFTGKTFSFVLGIEEADSDNTVGATPGMSSDFGLVKARITEDSLEFDMVYDPNGRAETAKNVISFPIKSQFDIKRETNDFGDSTNKIVEDKTAGWQSRQFMRVDWAHPKSPTATLLASLLGRTARISPDGKAATDDEGQAVASEDQSSLVEDPVVTKDGHISFLVESKISVPDSKTYTFPFSISGGQAYKVMYRTHLMPLKPSDYQPIQYTLKDFERFGYFFTQQDFQNPNGIFEKNQRLYVNAHNVCEAGRAASCSTNKIRWVLSKGFPDKYKETARKVVQEWNQVFKQQLNRKDDVVILDESVEANISDPSYNILAYYPNRTKSGLLGVAQWASNPQTGELLGVRATIYGDGIDYETTVVDDKINLLVSDDPLKDVIGTTGFGAPLTYVSPFNEQAMAKSIIRNRKLLGLDQVQSGGAFNNSPSLILRTVKSSMESTPDKADIRAMKLAAKVPDLLMVKDSDMIAEDAKNSSYEFPKKLAGFEIPKLNGVEQVLFADAKYDADREKILRDAELGIHGTELVEDAAVRYLYSFLKKGATKKDLENARHEIEEQVAQLTFYTTALHEMGHAFGLRHNFAGSADKDHFPQEYKDIEAKLAKKDPSVVKEDLDPYAASSIMDYTRDFFDQKNGLGTYDKAAIKYVYNRSINKESDPVTLAHYMFCTDHQVGESLLCQRFDKGHNVSEMVQGDIDLYDHNYAMWHYRRGRLTQDLSRGWGSPATLENTLLTRIFLPIRQTMDEFLYSFLSAQPADGEGYCGMKFVKASIDAGEMRSICNADEMEAAHVNPADLSSFVNALFNIDADGNASLIKSPSEYTPYGMADLLYANAQATEFFQRVLGAPEPGSYLPVPTKTGVILKPVDASGDIKAQAQEIAQEAQMSAASAQAYVGASPGLVTEIQVGGYGRQLESRTSTVGGWIRNESLGSYYDKIAVLKAMSKPLRVRKYVNASMNGNAYVFPQTKPWTSSLMNKVITGNPYIASVPLVTKGGQQFVAAVPAASNLDLQTYGALYALVYMSSETDKSMLNKLQICDINQAECSKPSDGSKTVEFHSAEGGNVYRAYQTGMNDSIAFNLVSAAKATDDQRKTWLDVRDNAGATQAANLLKLAKADGLRDKIMAEVAANVKLAAFVLPIDPNDKNPKMIGWADIIPNEWAAMNALTKQLTNVSSNTGLNVANEIYGMFSELGKQANTALKEMGASGQCWVAKYHPELVSQAPQKKTPEQFDAMIEAKAAAGMPGAPANAADTSVVAAETANESAATNACNADDPKEVTAGQARLNLMNLVADMKVVNTDYMQGILIADVKTLVAPGNINKLTGTLRSKEAQIDVIRKMSYQMTH